MSLRLLSFIVCAFFLSLSLPEKGLSADSDDALVARFEERRQAIAQLMEKATVYVLVDKGDSVSMGSGFVVADGYVMTNGHVVDEGQDNTILVMNSALPPTEATLVKMDYSDDRGSDFALLRFSPKTQLPVLSFNLQSSRMDRVSAWGFPYMITKFDQSIANILEGELKTTPPVVFTEGVVSTFVDNGHQRSIIHTAAIASGNSGGPLINSRGEVIGINTWGAIEEDEGAFVNAALPADRLVSFLQSAGLSPRISRNAPLGSMASTNSAQNTPAAPAFFGGTRPQPSAQPSARSDGSGSFADVLQATNAGAGIIHGSKTPSAPAASSVTTTDGEGWVRTMEEAANKGEVDAQLALGYAYSEGEYGVTRNPNRAEFWLKKAVAGDSSHAAGLLAILYISEPSLYNPDKAVSLLEQGSAKPEAPAEFQSLLALLYYEGESYGVDRNEQRAFYWAEQAAKAGDADAKALLGRLYYFGEGVDQDQQKALELAREAVQKDSAIGKGLLAWMYYHGSVVEEDLTKAHTLATEAAEEDDASAQGLLACLYEEGSGVKADSATAEAWARRAADQANEFGQFILGTMYFHGTVVKKDLVQAWALLDMAAQKNVQTADELRDEAAATMSTAQIRQAQALETSWRKAWKKGEGHSEEK